MMLSRIMKGQKIEIAQLGSKKWFIVKNNIWQYGWCLPVFLKSDLRSDS